ncbi:MAG: ATP-dependent helicase HrpB [Gemmatimonadales bacterium]
MPRSDLTLPIEPALPRLRDALTAGVTAVLQAPPGAGKTTRVPLALLDEPWLAGGRIVMLEPRRLAARAAARRMAEMLGEAVGATVGYRIRHETRVGPRTRVEVVTEGVLTRMLQSDPSLAGTGLLVFDEFHERSIHADLGLALALQMQIILRPDLRLLVMSATLDGGPVAALLGGAPTVSSEGRGYSVETRYVPRRPEVRVEAAVAGVVRDVLASETGDVLVFLPGAGEIRRVEHLITGVAASVIPLRGNLPQELQDQALRPSPPGRRKVVLATAIAETSLTIEGVRIVVDSGLARVPRYSPRTGMTRLATVRVSRASADQRRGRAGRLGPGVCYRLWAAHEDQQLLPRATPEILEADLTALALELAAAGVRDPAELAWLDPPPNAAYAEARALLFQLGALDAGGRLTSHGRSMSRLALHPRLAHMVLRGRELDAGDLACDLAALLSERDLLRWQDGPAEADLGLRLDLLRGSSERRDTDREALRRARHESRICRQVRTGQSTPAGASGVSAGVILGLAYPDRIAQRRPGEAGRFLLRNGQGAFLDPQPLIREEYLVAAELDGKPRESRILLATALTLEEIESNLANGIEEQDVIEWDPAARAVVSSRRVRLGALILREAPLRNPDPDRVAGALLEGIRGTGLRLLPWSEAARRLQARLGFLHRLDPAWADCSDAALLENLSAWLGPHIGGMRRLDELGRLDIADLLLGRLRWDQRAELDEWAPSHIQVASGSRIPLDYGDSDSPVLAVRLQELFGVTETPRVGRSKVPVTLHLLSPAFRPVQVTRDLAGFWRTTYFDVRRDLRGRYPRHHWPDDPLQAEPTSRAKRRG